MEALLVEKARITAARWHEEVNQKYDGLPYEIHLNLAGAIARKYIDKIPSSKQDIVLAAVYLHDTIEDCRKTYNDVSKEFGKDVAELVYAVTNEKGRNRKERASQRYYHVINEIKYAPFVKLCDRIANVLYATIFGTKMFEMYRKENLEFLSHLNTENYEDLVYDLNFLFETKIFNFSSHAELPKKL